MESWKDKQLDLFSWWKGMTYEEMEDYFDDFSNKNDYIKLYLNGDWDRGVG